MRFQYKLLLILALLFCVMATPGCVTAGKPPPSCPPMGCRVVIPPCQPPAYTGIPRDTAAQVSFRPYVATWLPDDVTWYTGGAYSSQTLPGQPRPWMRLEYGYWFPRPYNAYAMHTVIAFDEATQALGPTTNIYVPGQTLTVTSKTPVEINGQAATLFELQGHSSTSAHEQNETHVIGVQWQTGTVWMRVTALTSGRYFLLPNGDGEDVAAWDGTSTDVLLRVARSAQVYTGCDKKATGGPASN